MFLERIMKNKFITSLTLIITYFLLFYIFQPINISLANENDVNCINSPLESLKTIENIIINDQLLSNFKYKQNVRRNVFKDIKSTLDSRELAKISIKCAQRKIFKNKTFHKGNYSLTLLNKSENTLILALEAFNNHNYFKAQSLADKSYEYSMDAGPFGHRNPEPNFRIYYTNYEQKKKKNFATLYIINDDTDTGRKINICTGETFKEKLKPPYVSYSQTPECVAYNNSLFLQSFYIEEITTEKITISQKYIKFTFTIKKETMEYLLSSEF